MLLGHIIPIIQKIPLRLRKVIHSFSRSFSSDSSSGEIRENEKDRSVTRLYRGILFYLFHSDVFLLKTSQTKSFEKMNVLLSAIFKFCTTNQPLRLYVPKYLVPISSFNRCEK